MKISVIIPTYRPKEYLWQCIDSLRNQILLKSEYEVIIILNGNKEPYYTDIKKYLEKNRLDNFQLLYSEKKGVSAARNLGLSIYRGENIIFIDDDDYISPNYLCEMLKAKKSNDELIVSNIIYFLDSTNEKLKSKIQFKENKKYTLIQGKTYFNAVWMKLFPREIIDKKYFKEDLRIGEDSIFMLEVSKNIKSIRTINKNVIYYRRMRKNSVYYSKIPFFENLKIFLKNSKYTLRLLFCSEYNKFFILLKFLGTIKSFIKKIRGAY